MGAKERMTGGGGGGEGMQEGMRTGGEGLIKEQLPALNELRSVLVDLNL